MNKHVKDNAQKLKIHNTHTHTKVFFNDRYHDQDSKDIQTHNIQTNDWYFYPKWRETERT